MVLILIKIFRDPCTIWLSHTRYFCVAFFVWIFFLFSALWSLAFMFVFNLYFTFYNLRLPLPVLHQEKSEYDEINHTQPFSGITNLALGSLLKVLDHFSMKKTLIYIHEKITSYICACSEILKRAHFSKLETFIGVMRRKMPFVGRWYVKIIYQTRNF